MSARHRPLTLLHASSKRAGHSRRLSSLVLFRQTPPLPPSQPPPTSAPRPPPGTRSFSQHSAIHGPSPTSTPSPSSSPSPSPTHAPPPSSPPAAAATSQHLHLSLIPPRTPFVPDASAFLTLIGRSLSQHASKFPTWEALFTTPPRLLRKSGIEPARSRRYLIWWREKFRRGEFGIGGDLTVVSAEGVAELRALVPEKEEGEGKGGKKRGGGRAAAGWLVVNTRVGESEEEVLAERERVVVRIGDEEEGGGNKDGDGDGDGDGEREREGWGFGGRKVGVRGVKVEESTGAVVGSYLEPVKGSLGKVARLSRREGLWEVKRGRKVHGGERRRKYVLSVLRRKEKKDKEEKAKKAAAGGGGRR